MGQITLFVHAEYQIEEDLSVVHLKHPRIKSFIQTAAERKTKL
jgi:hypothetical protein